MLLILKPALSLLHLVILPGKKGEGEEKKKRKEGGRKKEKDMRDEHQKPPTYWPLLSGFGFGLKKK